MALQPTFAIGKFSARVAPPVNKNGHFGVGVLLFFLAVVQPTGLAQMVIPKPQAEVIARQKGWIVRTETPVGDVIEIQKIINDIPMYYATFNRTAADSVSSDDVWPGGSTGLSLSGTGVRLGIWDGGRVRTTHQEFGGRAVQRDGLPTLSTHATHVSGTMIGAGLSPAGAGRPAGQSRGMSSQATLDCYDFNSDLSEMSSAAAGGLLASNHSYGLVTGWRFGNFGAGTGWYWFGDVNVSTFEDYYFGLYSLDSAAWDQLAYKKPFYQMVVAAGNERNEGPSPGTTHFVIVNGDWVQSNAVRSLDGNSGFDSMSHSSLAKNVLSVGAVNDVVAGYAGPGSVAMSSFSSWGPADDGRIKPDVVANGVDLWSASSTTNIAYTGLSGTSMASPNVTGSLGLLIQHYEATHAGEDMRAATLKALVIHTADECGAASGPDYAHGWGLMNTAAAAGVITYDQGEPGVIQELALVSGEPISQVWTYSGSGPIKATMVWSDPPGVPPGAALDPPIKMLVNDLDLRIIGPDSTTYFPWRLDVTSPSAAATTGDNDVDNVEVIVIAGPSAGTYTVQVSNKGALIDGFQRFSLVLSGLEAGPIVTGACCTGDTCSGTVVESSCAGQWYGGADCGAFTCPPIGACCSGCAPAATCSTGTRADCDLIDGRWTEAVTCEQASCDLAGDVCASDTQMAVDGDNVIDNRCATTDGPTPVDCENGSQPFGKDIWFEYVSTCTGTLSISLCDQTNYDGIMAIYSNGTAQCACPTSSATQVGLGSDDSCGVGGGPPELVLNANSGTCYTLRVGGWDSASGTGMMKINCAPDLCPVPAAAENEPSPTSKSRFLSFVPGNAGTSTAIRVKLTSLHHPVPPYTGGIATDFSAMEGQYRWVGPPQQFQEASSSTETFLASALQCTPYYQDWGTVGLLHVTGSVIVPSSSYEVQLIDSTCGTELESHFSSALEVPTSRWSDVELPFNPPSQTAQPDLADVAALVNKFKSAPGALIKARALLAGDDVFGNFSNSTMSVDYSFSHIAACVNAFRGMPYPYLIEACP